MPDCDVAANCQFTSFSTGSFAGWTVSIPGTGGGGVFDPGLFGSTAGAGYTATDGDQIAWSNGGVLSQILSSTLTASTTYTLTIDVGRRPDVAFPGYDVFFLAGGTLLASFDENVLTPVSNSFATESLVFTALPGNPNLGQALEIRLQSVRGQTNWDNVRLDASTTNGVPEPGTLGLMGFGLLGFARLRRRRTP